MNKFGIIAVLMVFISAPIIPYTYKYWPPGKAQDFALIWVRGEQISELFKLADELGYKNIRWCPGNPETTIQLKSGEMLLKWSTDNDFTKFKNAVLESGLYCFTGRIFEERWIVSGSYDDETLIDGNIATSSQIHRYYLISEEDLDGVCRESESDASSLIDCKSKLFNNWYLSEEILTYSYELSSGET